VAVLLLAVLVAPSDSLERAGAFAGLVAVWLYFFGPGE